MEKKYDWAYESETNNLEKIEKEFSDLIGRSASETEIDNFITNYPIVLTYGLAQYSTGHHGSVVIPKQIMKPPIKGKERGMIPDFIMGGRNSDGAQWWIVELKGADSEIFKIFKDGKIDFSDTVSKGLCQLLEYVDFASENQAFLRDYMEFDDFREPNGLLIVGKEEELIGSKRKQKLKSAWNRMHRGRLEIRTFDWLVRKIEQSKIVIPPNQEFLQSVEHFHQPKRRPK